MCIDDFRESVEGKTPLVHLALEELITRAQTEYDNWRDFSNKVLPIYSDLVPLMKRCLAFNPSDRPTTIELMREVKRISTETFARTARRAYAAKMVVTREKLSPLFN